mmetsp:Transcript_4152/g.8111  ORF Transcript_4152/g.8111 Transcript_4152/m.8111 type:complete len:237 (-) Transcript_4152:77-787(-)
MMLRAALAAALLASATAFTPSSLSFLPKLRTSHCSAAGALRMASPVSSNDFRGGTAIKIDGNVYKVVEFLHVKPGKGSAFVRTKLRNLTTGGSIEKTFRAGEMVDGADVFKYDMQFNYIDGDDYVFMDMETFDTEAVPKSVIGDQAIWLKEGIDVKILKEGSSILDIEIPSTMSYEVTQTDPGEKGNTAQGASKPAILECGAEVMVPLFIKTGEIIRVDTVDKKYLGRDVEANKKK